MIARKGNKYYIVVWKNGKRKWIATGLESKADAELLERSMALIKTGEKAKFAKIINAIYGDDEDAKADLQTLIDDYPAMATAIGVKVSAETMRKRRNAIGRLAKWVENSCTGVHGVADITVPIAWRFIESIQATACTQRKIAGELSAVWECCLKKGVASSNPWKVAKPQKDESQQKHGRAFSMEEVKAILEACDADWQKLAVAIALYTGLRLGDIFNLSWDNISFRDGCIKAFKPSKTARHDIEVRLPLHPSLKAFLAPYKRISGKIVKATCTADRFGELYFSKILAKAGIVANEKEKISFHCLRHTFATMLASAGATEQERMSLGGWTSAKTASIYNHDDERNKILIERLPQL